MSALLVGLDLGTQSAKVVVHEADGTLVAEGRQPLRALATPAPGVVEHPDDDLWHAVGVACRAAMADLGARRSDVVAIGVCGIRFSRALVRVDGTLAAPVQSWMDDRVGRPHDAAAAPSDVARVTSSSGYLTRRLTGRFADSAAAYRGLWPIDLDTWGWSEDRDVVAACGVPRDRLVDLVLPGEVLGEVTAAAAEHTGLPAGVPVVATANDKAVEALGSGLRDDGEVLLSLGTYVAGMTPVRGAAPGERDGSWTNFACVPGEYLQESTGVRRGMWTVSWVRDLVAGHPDLQTPVGTGSLEDRLNAGARDVPPGSDGLLTVLDWLAPPDAPHRRGAFVGFDGRQGPFHLYRSVLEALAMTMHRHMTEMLDDLGRDLTTVCLSGGGARSDVVAQIVADVFGVPVARRRSASAAGLGAAICAAVAAGVHPGFDAALAAMVDDETVVDPSSAAHDVYVALETEHVALAEVIDAHLREHRGRRA